MAVMLIIGGFACVAWIIRREVIEREQMKRIRRGEARTGLGRALWEGFRRGFRMWLLGGAGVIMIAVGVAQLAQA